MKKVIIGLLLGLALTQVAHAGALKSTTIAGTLDVTGLMILRSATTYNFSMYDSTTQRGKFWLHAPSKSLIMTNPAGPIVLQSSYDSDAAYQNIDFQVGGRSILKMSNSNVGINMSGAAPSATLEVNGPVKGSSFSTGDVALKWKKFAGTLNAGGDASFSHGLDWDKIVGIMWEAYYSGSAWYVGNFTSGNYHLVASYDSTTIYLVSDIAAFQNQAYKVVVFYEP